MSFKFGTWELTKDGNGNGYEIIGFEKGTTRVRSSPIDRSFSHGSMDYADGKISGRQIRLIVRVVGQNAEHYQKLEDDLMFHAYQEDFKFYPDTQRYITVKRLVNADPTWENNILFKIMATWVLTFFCEDPFWYFGSVSQIITPNASPYTFPVFNIGTGPAFPIITIVPSASNPTMSLENLTDDWLMQYVDANFVASDSLVINSIEGTVVRNSANSIKYFAGTFPKLPYGTNSIRYTGALGTITIAYVNRYI